MERKKIITGHFGGQPIWRYKTAEEELQEQEILEGANLFISLQESLLQVED